MAIYGYCRVSTTRQKIERQIKNIKKAYPEIDEKDIYLEEWTGTTLERPIWKKLEKKLKEGDCVVFDSVSRMSRNASEGFELYKNLFEKGISIVFLKEPTINTDCYKEALKGKGIDANASSDEFSKMVLTDVKKWLLYLAEIQFKTAFEQAEKEVEDLRQRTREGFTAESRRKMSERSKANQGRKLTTKKSLELKPQIKKLAKAFDGNCMDKEVIKFLGLDAHTYYKYKKELKEELASND